MIAIIAHNNIHLTKKAVASALAQEPSVPVVVIDNYSIDDTAKWLTTKKTVASLYLHEQKSLSHCWNKAMRLAWSVNYTSVLLLNNDVEIRPDTFRLLDSYPADFVSCVSVDSQDRVGVPGDRTLEDLKKTERPHPDFSAFLIRKTVTDRVGWFNEDYFPAYVEDCDYHVRMHRAGIKSVCVDLPFLHHGYATLKYSNPVEKARIERGAQLNRGRFLAEYGCLPGTPEYQKLFEQEATHA